MLSKPCCFRFTHYSMVDLFNRISSRLYIYIYIYILYIYIYIGADELEQCRMSELAQASKQQHIIETRVLLMEDSMVE